jgi:ubiquinone/menaquinone biosynthesis C-methylase UbiE
LTNERPEEIVKDNTMEAFDAFYSADDYITTSYLVPLRLALYDLVADHCATVMMGSQSLDVVDVGCGTGHMLQALQRRMDSHKLAITGLDFSTVAVGRCRTLLPAATFVVGDLHESRLPASAYDIVLCIETLEHLLDPLAALRELLRICRPGGRLILTVPNGEKDSWDGHFNFWTPDEFSEYLRPYGLTRLMKLQDDTTLLAEVVRG